LYKEVRVILVRSDLEEVDVVSFRDVKAGILDGLVDLFRNHDTSVFYRTDDVIDETTDILTFVEVEVHAWIVSYSAAELRGIDPKRE
jgi:hypothetical protein